MSDLKNDFLELHRILHDPVRHDFIIPPPFEAHKGQKGLFK